MDATDKRAAARAECDNGSLGARGFNRKVGGAIRRARQDRGWTQVVLAENAKLSANYIARLERGELGPSLLVASRVCAALQIAIDSLVA